MPPFMSGFSSQFSSHPSIKPPGPNHAPTPNSTPGTNSCNTKDALSFPRFFHRSSMNTMSAASLLLHEGDGLVVVREFVILESVNAGALEDAHAFVAVQFPRSAGDVRPHDAHATLAPCVDLREILGVVGDEHEIGPAHVVAPLRNALHQAFADRL